MFKVDNKDNSVFIVNFRHVLHLVSIVIFEHAVAGWETSKICSKSAMKTQNNSLIFSIFNHTETG